ncbi:MAG: phosphate ABC transporter permease subunit PstC [Chloroflexales bacterium]
MALTKHGVGRRTGWRPSYGDRIFWVITMLIALGVIGLMFGMCYEMWQQSALSRAAFGWSFFWTTAWDPVAEEFGALPYIFGTVVSSLVALAMAGPIGIGIAIFLVELAPEKLRSPVGFLVEMLASIPSVVYGLWGLFVMVPWIGSTLGPGLSHTLGFLPIFKGPSFGVSMLSASLILTVMVIPTVAAVARDVLQAVPNHQREAMLAMGATKWEMVWHAVLPYGRAGIIGGVMLGLGRAFGETMAVTMVIGNQPSIHTSILQPGHTMAAVIANEFTEATYDLYLHALIEIGLVLFLVSFVLNLLARLLVWQVSRGPAGAIRA